MSKEKVKELTKKAFKRATKNKYVRYAAHVIILPYLFAVLVCVWVQCFMCSLPCLWYKGCCCFKKCSNYKKKGTIHKESGKTYVLYRDYMQYVDGEEDDPYNL